MSETGIGEVTERESQILASEQYVGGRKSVRQYVGGDEASGSSGKPNDAQYMILTSEDIRPNLEQRWSPRYHISQ